MNRDQEIKESIENANPSEALKNFKSMKQQVFQVDDDFEFYADKVEQALLKAQDPKHYLKWEDLEFTRDEKVMTVKMGDTVYKILYRYCYGNEEVQLLSEDEKLLCLNLVGKYKDNVQLFNDLRLEKAAKNTNV